MARTIKAAHDGALFTLMVDKAGNIVSGGRDGKIVQWDRSLTRTGNVLEVSWTGEGEGLEKGYWEFEGFVIVM